jgi:hypothetical protein
MEEYPQKAYLNAYAMKCAVRLHAQLSEKYISGNMAINMKMDSVGLPILLIGTFFPHEFPTWLYKDCHAQMYI